MKEKSKNKVEISEEEYEEYKTLKERARLSIRQNNYMEIGKRIVDQIPDDRDMEIEIKKDFSMTYSESRTVNIYLNEGEKGILDKGFKDTDDGFLVCDNVCLGLSYEEIGEYIRVVPNQSGINYEEIEGE